MSKLIGFCVIAVLFINSSLGEVLNCEYLYYDEDGYNCKMKDTFDEPTEITSVSGEHRVNKDIDDVSTFYIPSASNSKYLPTKVCSQFKNLTKIDVYLKTLMEVKREIFDGCTKLESIFFRYLDISTIDENLFSDIPTLKEISITSSSIESLPKDLFKNNPNLISIILNANKLKTIDFELTTEQKNKLKKFTVFENVCMNDGYRSDDYRSPTLETVLKKLDDNCRTNSTATESPPLEDTQEQRIVILEEKVENVIDLKRNIGEKIQTESTKLNRDLSILEIKYKSLSKDIEDFKAYVNSNLTVAVNETYNKFEELHTFVNEINERSRSMEAAIDENSKIKEKNDELQENIHHNKSLMIAVFCIQIVTIGLAVFVTIFFKFFSSRNTQTV